MYEIYRHLAARLGLHLSPPDPGMMTFEIDLSGVFDGQIVRLKRYCGRAAWIRVSAPLTPDLDLGLGLAPSSILSTLSEWFGAEDIQVGDAGFDEKFAIRGDEAERVRAMLNAEVREDLGSDGAEARRLTDSEVWLELSTDVEGVDALELALRSVVRTANLIGAARRAVPPASALRPYYEHCQVVAMERGWQLEATPFVAYSWNEPTFAAKGIRTGRNEYAIELSLGASRLDVPLLVEPRRTFVERWLSTSALLTGDPVFDEAFELRRVPPEHIARLFTTDVRDRLLACRNWGALFLDQDGVKLRAPLESFAPEDLPTAVDALNGLQRALREAAASKYSASDR